MAYPIHQHKCQMTRGGLSCWRAAYPEDTARAHCRCRRRQFYCSSSPMSWIWHKRNNMSDSFGHLDGFFLQFCSRNGWTFCHFSTLQYLTFFFCLCFSWAPPQWSEIFALANSILSLKAVLIFSCLGSFWERQLPPRQLSLWSNNYMSYSQNFQGCCF